MSDESLFREVDEEVRQEQFLKLWKRHGNAIIAACLAVVVAVAAFKGWQYWQLRQAEAAAMAYFDAVKLGQESKPTEEAKALADISHSGFGQLARLRRAAALAQAGKPDEAVAAFDALAADSRVDQALRDLARIRAGYLLVDKLKPTELATRLSAFETPVSPWRNEAREIYAMSAYRSGDHMAAQRYASEIVADPEAPSGLRQRARILLQLLAPLLARSASL